MLETVQVRNFKSIENLSLELGRVNVFIGENGAGKSNILEALAIAGAAEAGKLDNEFLASRGIRVTSPRMMRSGFKKRNTTLPVRISARFSDGASFDYTLNNDNKPYSTWINATSITPGGSSEVLEDFTLWLINHMNSIRDDVDRAAFSDQLKAQLRSALEDFQKAGPRKGTKSNTIPVHIKLEGEPPPPFKTASNILDDFIIYSPENSSLRTFEREGQIEPLGVNGEGLLKFLSVLQSDFQEAFGSVRDSLRMLSWFDDLSVVQESSPARLKIADLFIDEQLQGFDQRSANEGFLFVAFYFALFASKLTPKFFAVDNIDASLNPRLCYEMVRRLAHLAEANDKQVILTTHNPAVLDGLDLRDDDQRLFVITRDRQGKTKARRFHKQLPNGYPARMSELFLRGVLGGLPKAF